MLRLLNNLDKPMVLKYLDKHHIECTFLIGNVISFSLENDVNLRRGADYYGYFESNALKGIVGFYNLGSCIPHYEVPEAIPYFADLLKSKVFDTLLGMEKIVKPLYDEIKDSKQLETYSEDSYYINDNFTPYNLGNVDFVGAKTAPTDKATHFIMEAFKDGFRSVKTPEEISKMLNEKSSEEDFLFLVKDGEIKAQANVQTYTSKFNQIGGVFTLRSERGKGYCKATVSEICKLILARGKTPTLMVRKNNTPAVSAYQSLGFRHYDDYLIISFKKRL